MKWIHWSIVAVLILIGLVGDGMSFMMETRSGFGGGDESIIETGTVYWAFILLVLAKCLDAIIDDMSGE